MTGNPTVDFFLILATAALLRHIPFIKRPIQWLEVFFHELSHGLVAILTFGHAHRLEITWQGAGCMTTRGGIRILILLAGYMGAVVWGTLIALAGAWLGAQGATALLWALSALVGLTILFFVRDLVTLAITLFMLALFALPLHMPGLAGLPIVLRIAGTAVTLNALYAPLDLIDGQLIGDGAELQKRTLLPEGVWILVWVLWGLVGLSYIWQLSVPVGDRWMSFLPFVGSVL